MPSSLARQQSQRLNGFLYAAERFRLVGKPRVALSPRSADAVADAHARLVRSPDAVAVACLCGGGRESRVTLCDRYGLPHSLVLCERCGLIRANPQPSPEFQAWFYAHAYREMYGPHTRSHSALFASKLWKGELIANALRSADVSFAGGPVLDLGCGGGWALMPFANSGRTCIGFDYDPEFIDLGRGLGLDLRLGGIPRAREAGLKAALVIFAHVLEHVAQPLTELESIRPLLADDGLLYLEVPHTRRIGEKLGSDSLAYWQRAHLWDFQREHLVSLAEAAGFQVVWQADDENSAFALCRLRRAPGAAGAPPLAPSAAWPDLGVRVRLQLEGFERAYQSRTQRLLRRAEAVGRAWVPAAVRRGIRAAWPR